MSNQTRISALRIALVDARPLYFLPNDKLTEEVLIPAFGAAVRADCMVGFFSSEVLASLAPGLATYINSSTNSFRLIVSPFIQERDRRAMEDGLRSPEEVANAIFEQLIVTKDFIQQHTLKCLSYLLKCRRLEIRIGLMKRGLFHPKVWIFESGGETVAAHGSSNATHAGITDNFEQITVSKSWVDPTQTYIIDKLRDKFELLWEKHDETCFVVGLSQAIEDQLLQKYCPNRAPTEEDYLALYRKAKGEFAPPETTPLPTSPLFKVPSWLKYDEGPFEHQGRAVRAWVDANFRGVLEMATGSGKTLTSMLCAYRLFEVHQPLLIVVAAPYIPLIEQWCDEVQTFGLKPLNLTTVGNAASRARAIQQVTRRLRLGLTAVEILIVSHDTLCASDFHEAMKNAGCNRLLVADEAHNLGRPNFISNTPEFFEFRLALSATPVRQYDPEGTDAVFAFFGPVVFRFPLEEAIGRCLVEYNYYVHPVELSDSEMDMWSDITAKIRKNAWRQQEGQADDYLNKLFRDRRALLETAAGKIAALGRLLDKESSRSIKHTLIYTSDKGPAQLDQVNLLLREKGILFHQLTHIETSDRQLTRKILQSFQDGEIQVLTAKRVLDEGVNIPQVTKAYILASTTVERQWIQRRGRLLRTCSAISKTSSTIHDLLALPPDIDAGLDPDAKSLVRGELHRAQEFARLARNAGRADGPLAEIDALVHAVFS